MTKIKRAYTAEIDDVSKKDRTIVARINTASVDRYKTVILPDGIDLRAFKENPVVLWEHGLDPKRGSMPIGRNLWIKSGGGKTPSLVAKTQFAKDQGAQDLLEMYAENMLRGWSVNIIPENQSTSAPTKDELLSNPTWSTASLVYRRSELAEYSAVAVPGNAEALTMLEARGFWFAKSEDPGEIVGWKWVEKEFAEQIDLNLPKPDRELPPLVGRTFEEAKQAKLAAIRAIMSPQKIVEETRAAIDLMKGRV